ncbi:hypothetical protein [Halobellus ruber]|uniref:Uncharacterized protein n=1 Tax=Halobellus ruber TaxID=2761102 RepID=A0A7J9SKW8_9EURY|nr:hypothetical protein [Halobellus ruber]MBB6646676.1 hypothetical protein [Halobellus ruber]
MVTQTHSPFETLARVIEHLDDDGRTVRRTEAAGGGGDGALRATVDVSVGALSGDDAGFEPTDAAVDGALSVTFRAPAFPDPAEALSGAYPGVSVDPTDVWVEDGAVVVTLAVTIGGADRSIGAEDTTANDGADGASGDEGAPGSAASTFGSAAADGAGAVTADATETGSEDAHEADADQTSAEDDEPAAEVVSPLDAVRDESVPPYDDTPYLRRLYETCGTFAEMSERIEMDVSAETVRRYMIEADVHSPTSYETGGGAASGAGRADGSEPPTEDGAASGAGTVDGSEPPTEDGAASTDGADRGGAGEHDPAASLPDEQLVADGIGLPESLTLRDVVDAVVGARTVHEVQREIGLDYDRTRQLLTQLNVLDLVVGRVAADRTVTVDIVADRIRQCTPDAA